MEDNTVRAIEAYEKLKPELKKNQYFEYHKEKVRIFIIDFLTDC